MTYDLDTLIELESLLGSEALIILRDLHAAGYRVVKYDADKQLSPAPVRKFKVGDCVRVLTGFYAPMIGIITEDDGDPEIERPYHVTFEGKICPCIYSAHELKLVQEAK